MAKHSKALITGRALTSPFLRQENYMGQSQVTKCTSFWHYGMKHKKGDPRDSLSQRAIRDSLSDPIMMNIATHPSDSRLLTQPCRGCSAFVWRALLQGHGHERKKSNRSSNKSVLPATSPGLKYTQQFIQLPSISCNMICGG